MKPKSVTTVQNPTAASASGTHRARIVGLDGRLFLGVGLLYIPAAGRPSSFGANTFTLYGVVTNADGIAAQLSETPLNGASGQAAPDAWEGRTTLPEIELVHSFVGLGAGSLGHWEAFVYAYPAIEMCDADFKALFAQVDIRAQASVTAT